MNAIYKGKLYRLGDNLQHVELHNEETGATLTAPWSDPELIIDPTDDEINNILPDEIKLSKWWRTPSAKAAMRRAEKEKRERFKKLRKLTDERKQRNDERHLPQRRCRSTTTG
jgi:hypothetical protein